jgi:hypothetical protein
MDWHSPEWDPWSPELDSGACTDRGDAMTLPTQEISPGGSRGPLLQVLLQAVIPSHFDREEVAAILGGEHTHFGAHLMRLIKRADQDQREVLRLVYPYHVQAVETFERGECER